MGVLPDKMAGKGQEKVAGVKKKIKQSGRRVAEVIDDINKKYSV